MHIYYQVLEAMFYIFRGDRPKTTKDAVQFFRGAVQELSGKHRRAGEYLIEHWPELKRAIERCRQEGRQRRAIAYDITTGFIEELQRPTTALDRVLRLQEKPLG